jgi:hypothetical protein
MGVYLVHTEDQKGDSGLLGGFGLAPIIAGHLERSLGVLLLQGTPLSLFPSRLY